METEGFSLFAKVGCSIGGPLFFLLCPTPSGFGGLKNSSVNPRYTGEAMVGENHFDSDFYEEPGAGGEGFLTSLDTQETSVPPDDHHSYRSFLASGCSQDMQFAKSIYELTDDRDGSTRAAKFSFCRTSAYFVRHRVSGEVRVASSRCKLRWCPLCIRTKRFILVTTIVPWLKAAVKPKFLTLTLKHSNAPLDHQIRSLYAFSRNLRRRPWFKKRCKGGIWFFQLTQNKDDNTWHPHLHILCEGHYIPQRELSDVWLDVTGNSKIVHIEAVKDVKKAADYVARYATAPCRLSDYSVEDATEIFDALHGMRICGTFGTGRKIKLSPQRCEDADDWIELCKFSEVMKLRSSTEYHQTVYESWVKGVSCPIVPKPPPDHSKKVEYVLEEKPVTYRQFAFEWGAGSGLQQFWERG
jgi:hypothetical protein